MTTPDPEELKSLARLDAMVAKMTGAVRGRLASEPTDMTTMVNFLANLNHDEFDKSELAFMFAAALLDRALGHPASQPAAATDRPAAAAPPPDLARAVTLNTIRTVALTLRQLAGWGTARQEMSDQEFRDLADQVEATTTTDWWSCPMCEEVVCDGGCPLEHVREALHTLQVDPAEGSTADHD